MSISPSQSELFGHPFRHISPRSGGKLPFEMETLSSAFQGPRQRLLLLVRRPVCERRYKPQQAVPPSLVRICAQEAHGLGRRNEGRRETGRQRMAVVENDEHHEEEVHEEKHGEALCHGDSLRPSLAADGKAQSEQGSRTWSTNCGGCKTSVFFLPPR